MVECYSKGVKYSLLIANSIIFPTRNLNPQLSGAAVLALGIWTVSDRSFMERLLGINLYVASSVLFIITGTIVALISLLGSLGAYKELKCMLKTYFGIQLLLLGIIVAVCSLSFVFRAELEEKVRAEMQSSMRLYGNDSHVTEAWDSIQINFECCGVNMKNLRGFESWRRESPKFNVTDGPVVPESCCRSREEDQTKRACQGRQPRKEDTWVEGCYEKMKSSIKSHAYVIGGAALFVVLLIIFGLILSGTLFLILRNRPNESLADSEEVN